MPLTSVYFTLYILSKLVTVRCYTYQTEPLFLSFSELAALEAAESVHHTNKLHFEDHKVKTFVLKCHEDSIEVVMKAYLFDPGLPVEPTHLRLGRFSAARDHCTAKVSGNGEYVIRAPLTECGSKVTFTQSAVLYNNLLLYSPPPTSPRDVLQAEGAAIPVQCEYGRRYTVSSGALKPTWSPKISIQSTHLDLDFHLRLMMNDWSSERKSSIYFLGDVVNIEASVDHHHPPLRLYADSCVATLTSDVNSYPRYPFIHHRGCFADSQLDGSSSRFLPRVQDQLLQIQLEPFLFHQDHRHSIYITCNLEAEPISHKDPVKKACSFMSGRWRSVDGDDRVCESCSSIKETNHSSGVKSNHKRALRSKTRRRQTELHGETSLGPIIFLPLMRTTVGKHKHLY
ncbi:zona pellucida sperm-binding protein 3-like isoform X1 [Sebastes umbrosus]|uniref:zona pellucida sperm-binding protein 3-like isoform X1 n=2 Tax=Sebastes umbrosus TaxID=72105 RepID=UPI0018A11D6A|nr:zona pellucida sperm-binding protein 3-like isoform X1 [Sebastes umbrosus]